ncbi:hypothetical protein CHL67_11815 [Prosthecochloris sp. GSB1]|uniref:ribonuclease P protein component n=1 Tax=Prosthecochloris sp. GSB1 TaxID=281093 RepID=UPI000B8C6EC3|nr:ribonuclease P protein component [Prosthecochloris sp. GSB1]ASQ91521.1 hypothetical protein CHL67_11815 [Prosthecochloris sp. GSB1]
MSGRNDMPCGAHVHSLKKYEILRGRKAISRLFSSGDSLGSAVIRLLYMTLPAENGCRRSLPKVLFVVGKKKRPRAVDRNRIKRLMKEAYRYEKQLAMQCAKRHASEEDALLCMALVYTGKKLEIPSAGRFRKEVRFLLEGLLKAPSQG